MKFSPKAEQVINTIQTTTDNIFVTGRAGTGKSTLLDHIRLISKKKIIVLAPTGIAAINVRGETIHSFFTLKPGYELDEAKEMRITDKHKKKFKNIKTIAIDEISMVRADILDAIDTVLRRARNNNEPFGGVQMLFFGDLYQLPPVVTHADKDKFFAEYNSPYFFDANVFTNHAQGNFFSDAELQTIELNDIYRQKDPTFIEVLNAVRDGAVNNQHLQLLNARCNPHFEPKAEDNFVHLVTTNAMANTINQAKMDELGEQQVTFSAKQEGKIAKNLYPNDLEITLCVGAQIMFIYNDPERLWVNGTIGKILHIKTTDNFGKEVCVITVEKNDGRVVEVTPYTWEISKYQFKKGVFEREMIGSFTQVPLKLAWAMTIHKSQGKTFEKVIIDLGRGSFAHGQTYVALSRCTTLDGIILRKKFYQSSIVMDKRVHRFWESN